MSGERVQTAGYFRFEMGGVLLGGATEETYSVANQQWEVTYEGGGQSAVGVGEYLTDAYLDLIRVRLGGPSRRAGLIDGRESMVHQRILSAVVERMAPREFREWFSGHRAISGREFYEGKP